MLSRRYKLFLLSSFFTLFFQQHFVFATASNTHAKIRGNLTHEENFPLISSKKITFLPSDFVFTLSAGASSHQLGLSESFTPLDLCSYNYQPNHSKSTNMLWGGFIGSEIKHTPSWRFVAGLAYYQPTLLSTKGKLTQGADPISSDTFNYQYKTRSQQVLAEGKWYWMVNERLQPFIMIGMGASFNTTSNYQTDIPPFLQFTPIFAHHTQTNFTYAIGPGVEIPLSKSLRLGVAYRFTDLGAADTGHAQIDRIPIPSTLKQSNLYANQILAQFTFIPWKN